MLYSISYFWHNLMLKSKPAKTNSLPYVGLHNLILYNGTKWSEILLNSQVIRLLSHIDWGVGGAVGHLQYPTNLGDGAKYNSP